MAPLCTALERLARWERMKRLIRSEYARSVRKERWRIRATARTRARSLGFCMGFGVSSGKMLKALAGAGMIHTQGRAVREGFGFSRSITELGRNIRHNSS